ncbi:MAG: hypothetical protein MI924_10365, partial [Chloroflexales bacterium]|nr:hypothetical protein [Chloroflexales bacterium]
MQAPDLNLQHETPHRALSARPLLYLGQALGAELGVWRAAVRAPSVYALLVALALSLAAVQTIPFNYVIDVGYEEGYGNDYPFLYDFNTAERGSLGTYRWTADNATLLLAGLGQRPLLVRLYFLPLSPEIFALAPHTFEIWSGDRQLATLPVQPEGGAYSLLVPSSRLNQRDFELTIRTETFSPPQDSRYLGAPLDRIEVQSLAIPWHLGLSWTVWGAWMLAALFALMILRSIFRSLAPNQRWTTGLMSLLIGLVVLAAALDLPRWALGAQTALQITALGYGLAFFLRLALPSVARKLRIPLDERTLVWLILIIVVAFGLRYGGRLYPGSMPGDIGFHNNRFTETILGRVFLLSRNRGVDFPYPPAPYLLLAPFVVSGIGLKDLLQFGAALLESCSAALIYAIVMRTAPGNAIKTALIAAAIYVFTAAGFMTSWWSFSTHIYSQFALVLLITAFVLASCRPGPDAGEAPTPVDRDQPEPRSSPNRRAFVVIGVLLCLVFLGHFGFFINTVLLGGLMVALVWAASWCGITWAKQVRWPMALTYGGAALFVGVFFYSAYISLFLFQLQATAEGGLTGLAQRNPANRADLWRVLWEAGLIIHFGFFPLALALLGPPTLLAAARKQTPNLNNQFTPAPALILVALMAGSFLISLCFAILPFITLSTQSTRWLMFSAWAVAVSAALVMRLLWRYGWTG